jgi:hypothetical protein
MPLLPLVQNYESGDKTISFFEVHNSIKLIGLDLVSLDQVVDAILY